MTFEETKAVKDRIRAAHRHRRASLSAKEREEAGAALASHGLAWADSVMDGSAATVCVYLGVGAEPPTLPLIRALYDGGRRVLLPVCEPGRELKWVFWAPGTDLVTSRFAPILEPVGTRQEIEVAGQAGALFIPATAVDLAGSRVGQGGGYYDKFLGHLASAGKNIPLAAVIYDEELLPAGSIPVEEFDRPVPGVVLPSGFRKLAVGA
ncbi:5-formyltetrahydrofolate cyclo-ligase [Pseudarthrobacter phenanthrenivorans]|uniref:5-formyltetrahydrofolate cyclo-ligase n=1 Tax=Pseudarthrobacter phenanthrenivorans TaxID=361575 RepID=A0A3B0G369_PSEPS|nr:5-formyltetrahydrofolate cyclo-ligase [Pseudarthrobacter phenanthrenivorans]RKO26610.1 5-formyltetrahydrofolate cyclo-ligase [Pseudarthrobacter phenanthrenivorans]TPV52040.1 5-formyltetrahydrofolate cyclo-ligase [Pseudarthrobacter phenanthrenivorans]